MREMVRTGVVGKDHVGPDKIGVYGPLVGVGGEVSLGNVRPWETTRGEGEATHEENVDKERGIAGVFLQVRSAGENLGVTDIALRR